MAPASNIRGFVDKVFNELVFQNDDLIASKARELVSPTAQISVNGMTMIGSEWTDYVLGVFRKDSIAELDTSENTAVAEEAGFVAVHKTFRTVDKTHGKTTKHKATYIVRVEEIDGKRLLTKMDEVTESLWKTDHSQN